VEDGVADALHGLLGRLTRSGAAGVEDFEDLFGVLLVVEAAGADWLDPLDEVIGHGGFALDTADAGSGATLTDPFEAAGIAFRSGEEFVPVEDGADVGIAGVGAAFAGGVGDHHFGFLADVVVGFGEGDGVAIGFGHFAAVEAGDARSGGEEDLGFLENARVGEERFDGEGNLFEEIGDAHFQDALAEIGGGDGFLFRGQFVPFRKGGFARGDIKHLGERATKGFAILGREQGVADVEAVIKIEAADEFAGELDVGDLVFADGNEQRRAA